MPHDPDCTPDGPCDVCQGPTYAQRRPACGQRDACLCAHAAIRSGAGAVTVAIPEALNLTLQSKLPDVIMSWPLAH